MSDLPPDPYDRTVIIPPTLDNPDRSGTVGTGRDFVVSLRERAVPGSSLQFLNANGDWVQFTTSEFAAWGGIIGTLSAQTDLWTELQARPLTAALAQVAFTGSYPDLIDKPIFGDLAFIGTNGQVTSFLRGDGTWGPPVDVAARWGSITGTLSQQTDLQSALDDKAPLDSPIFIGAPRAPAPLVDDSSERISTTAWLFGQAFNGNPVMDGSPSSGDSLRWARGNHRHPSDTSRAPLDSPIFSGTPQAPTPGYPNDSTRLATTAYVKLAIAGAGFTPPPSDGKTYAMKDGVWVALDLRTAWDKAS